MTVFVAAEERMIVGVYSTKERAQAECDAWAVDATEGTKWHRYDGSWQRDIKYADSNWLTLRVTECEVDE